MKKINNNKIYKSIFVILILFILGGCTKTISTSTLAFTKTQGNYYLDSSTSSEHLDKLKEDLNNLGLDYNKDTKVAVIATSTANVIDELGMNIVASTSSKSLNENLQKEIADGQIINLGSALEPNLEQLAKAGVDVVFVGSNMPHQDKYDSIENLIVLPQEEYYDIYYTIGTLIDVFKLDQEASDVFNEMVEYDQEAKKIAQKSEISGQAVALKYAYGNVTIAPDNTYVGSLLKELNIPNMYGDKKDINLPMSKEQLLLDNPEHIILYGKGEGMDEQLESLKTNEDLKNLKAYQDNQIVILKSESLNADIDSSKTLLELSKEIYEK